MHDHDDGASARRRVWIRATTKQTLPRRTRYADAKGSDIDPGEYQGPYRPNDYNGSDLFISRREAFPHGDDLY